MLDAREVEFLTVALRDRRVTENAYLRATGDYWRREGRRIYRKWRAKLPEWVSSEEVEQEMLTNAIYEHRPSDGTWARRVDLFDPARSGSILAFVLYGARSRTRRALHKMRGARVHGNEGKNAGHFEVNFSKIVERKRARSSDGGGDFNPEDLVPVFSSQDERAAVREVLSDALEGSGDVREAVCLRYLFEASGDPDDATDRMFGSFSARVELGLHSAEQARRLVERVLRGVVSERVAAA